ncbi:phosphatidylinositol glycan anchor biosynthesis class U protein [Eucalyptus grandis]|uniref:phosphatidylinositol glycan anchor biosynthesis class U protein n=1 Tax=Eucalyptus grandis TaxID=71139 RepID=UPI00192F0FCC|nr:phosphatidylinositol glycan anchor biosynthesis class U protein [Eucalyptus grandis]
MEERQTTSSMAPATATATAAKPKTGTTKQKRARSGFWRWLVASVAFRLALVYLPRNLRLSTRPEVATPLTSIRRLAEGYWLKQSAMSPYAGSMYHGSPLLLLVLGPLAVKRIEGQPEHLLCSLLLVIADILNAMLIRAIGQSLQKAYAQHLESLDLFNLSEESGMLPSGDIAALVYLWNPFTIVACVGLSTSPIENLAILLALFGACKGLVPLAAFGWVLATHMSLYPAILIIPIILFLGYGPDAPPRKLLPQRSYRTCGSSPSSDQYCKTEDVTDLLELRILFSWRRVTQFLLWTFIWGIYFLFLCDISVKQYGGLSEMFKRTYGFILTVKDLSPNIGVLWYFFAEVFDFFRDFFLIVFHVNILFMMLPLAIRLKHQPGFLAFVYLAISSMFKSYPSIGDSALYLGVLALFVNELAEMKFSFFLFCGYVGVSLLSPVMHNLWIWRGTGNANFYFATAMAYACLQIILVVESVSAMLNHDRKLRKLTTAPLADGKS